MLVNINGAFKTPVAHYLIDSLNGTEKSILLKDLLIALGENKINVIGITFDGDPAHKTACEKLGANFNYKDKTLFKPFFEHPLTSKPVYIFFDACHCLKLCRNYFALKGPIIYKKNKYIDWSFIIKLNDIQNHEQLHCANKITNRDVFFHNEKMKVFLAAQTLSRSISVSLRFLQNDLNDPNFANSDDTAEFCQMFDEIFDLLNVRSQFNKSPNRPPLTKDTLIFVKNKIDTCISYIENLYVFETMGRRKNTSNEKFMISVLESRSVKTGFFGFIISLTNLYYVANYLISNNFVNYFLSYKLSQDHIEMFFSLVRSMNGHNNNPTTTQYMSSYKKLVCHKMTSLIFKSGNCKPLDNTLLLAKDDEAHDRYEDKVECQLEPYSIPSVASAHSEIKVPKALLSLDASIILHKNSSYFWDHDYTDISQWCVNEYSNEIIAYTAGSIIHVLKKKIHCTHCFNLLIGSNTQSNVSLITLRNWGGLNYASRDVQIICKCTETVIRRTKNIFQKNIYTKTICDTLQILPKYIFDDNHFVEQEALMDHRSQLIMLIISKYIDIRLRHEGKLLNNEKQRIRMKNNKITIFSGQ